MESNLDLFFQVENYDYEESTNTDDEATNVIGDQSLERWV